MERWCLPSSVGICRPCTIWHNEQVCSKSTSCGPIPCLAVTVSVQRRIGASMLKISSSYAISHTHGSFQTPECVRARNICLVVAAPRHLDMSRPSYGDFGLSALPASHGFVVVLKCARADKTVRKAGSRSKGSGLLLVPLCRPLPNCPRPRIPKHSQRKLGSVYG